MMSDHSSRNIYLEDIPREQAWERFLQALSDYGLLAPLPAESIPLDLALGRITAKPIWARRSSPHYHAAAMDGYALRSGSTEGVSDRNPMQLTLGTECTYVDTGDVLPDWSDAVLPVEVVEVLEGEIAIRIFQAVPPWYNVRPMGEDIVTTELIIPAGHTLRAIDLGAIAAGGHASIQVVQKPRIAVIPTGSELIPLERDPQPGQIPEFNSLMLAGQLEGWGALATRWSIVPDNLESIREAIHAASIDHDMVLINAGSSAGSEDFTAGAINAIGQVLVHGVAVRPGHPVILGLIELPKSRKTDGIMIPAIGVPGYPVSAALTADIFIQPLLRIWLGQSPSAPLTMEATLTRKLHSSAGDEEHVRVTLGKVKNRWVAAPLSRGAGVISSLVRADGILVVPPGSQGVQAGETVQIRLLRSREELEQTILVLGSHDLTLDLLAQHLAKHGRRLSSNNIGSIGGLVAINRGEAHLGGAHLLDPESGEYNVAYIQKYLPETPVTLVALARREQGLIVQSNNPKEIAELDDLQREDVRYINRQRGSGTRLLFDHLLNSSGISPDTINGYQHEEYTHLTVASAIASGKVDCGMGIRAAASALGLGFIPMESERYDLVVPTAILNTSLLEPLFLQLKDSEFKQAVEALDGYDASVMGESLSIDPA
jgi:putative molybdopterin biosynthesis protein